MKSNLTEKIQRAMQGRNGSDNFGHFLSIFAFILLILGIFFMPFLSYVALPIAIYQYFRLFSRNKVKRYAENIAYLKIKNDIIKLVAAKKRRFSQRKTHHFFKCPSCHKILRIPKGKGKIIVTCPACSKEFEKIS